jgi:predicted Rossmann fold nucleotide-binding protein DprA/Smf involved in DNA uptake
VTPAIVISGSRQTEHRGQDEYERLFTEFLAPFANTDQTRVFVGGAKGIDSLALTWLVNSTPANIVVAAPGTVEQQPDEAKAAITDALGSGRVEVVELAHPEFPSTAAYHARNRWMVDRAQLLVAFPYGNDPNSGTWYTTRYAADQAKPRLIVPI